MGHICSLHNASPSQPINLSWAEQTNNLYSSDEDLHRLVNTQTIYILNMHVQKENVLYRRSYIIMKSS